MSYQQLNEYCDYIETNRSSVRVVEKTLEHIKPLQEAKDTLGKPDVFDSVSLCS